MSRLFKRHTGNKAFDLSLEMLPRPLLHLLRLDRKRVIMPADAKQEGAETAELIKASTLPGEGRQPLKTGILNAEAEKIAAAASDALIEVQACKSKDTPICKRHASSLKEKGYFQAEEAVARKEAIEAEGEYTAARKEHQKLLGRYRLSRWGYRAFLVFAAVADLCIAAFAWAFFSANWIEQGVLSLGVIAVLLVMAHKLSIMLSSAEPDDAENSNAATNDILRTMNRDPRVVIGAAATIILFTGIMRAVSMAKILHLGPVYIPLMGLGFIAINFGITYAAAVLGRYAHDFKLEETRKRFKEAKTRLKAAKAAHKDLKKSLLEVNKRIAVLETSRQSNYEYYRARIMRCFYITELHIMAFRSGYNLVAGLPVHTVDTDISKRLENYRNQLINEIRPRVFAPATDEEVHDDEVPLYAVSTPEPDDEVFESEDSDAPTDEQDSETLTIPATSAFTE